MIPRWGFCRAETRQLNWSKNARIAPRSAPTGGSLVEWLWGYEPRAAILMEAAQTSRNASFAHSSPLWYSPQMSLATDRRHFMQTLAVVSLCGFSLGCRESQAVEEHFKDIPPTLPHLESIRVYPVANCKHVLVHVRQSHESNHDEVVYLARGSVSQRTVACQRSIRAGIGEVLAKLPCHAIYVEGLKGDDVSTMRSSVNGFRDIIREQERFKARIQEAKRRYQSPGTRSDNELQKIAAIEQEVARFDAVIAQTVTQLDRTSISHSTAIQIAATHNLVPETPNTEPVERFLEKFSAPYERLEELNHRVFAMSQRAKAIADAHAEDTDPPTAVLEEMRQLEARLHAAVEEKTRLVSEIQRQLKNEQDGIFSLREDAIVALIAARPLASPNLDSSLVLFGAQHDLLPEIKAHNMKHPENTIALVVVTPVGLGEVGAK